MPLRNRFRRIERGLRGELDSFPLSDGGRYFFDPLKAQKDIFAYSYDAMLGNPWPEPPEIYRRLTEAADVRAALAKLEPDHPEVVIARFEELFDIDALLERRELIPLAHEPAEDLSES